MRLPPRFVEGEKAILGGLLLLDNKALSDVAGQLTVEDFSLSGHAAMFSAMLRLHEQNAPVDWATLTAELQRVGDLEKCGGPSALMELADAVPSAANIRHYVDRVREKAIRRRVIAAAQELAEAAYQEDTNLGEFLDGAEQVIFQQNESLVEGGWSDMRSLSVAALGKLESLYERKEACTGVPTGFADLDRLTAGWQPADLIIVAGRPSMGKTAFALCLGLYASMKANVGVGLFSLEMSKDALMQRMLATTARVNLQSMRTGYLSEQDWGQLVTAVGSLESARLWIDDKAAQSPLEIRTKARRLKREHGLGMVVVDYLQLMRANQRNDSREREVSEITRSLKALAKELDVPVIALSQLNRKVEERPDKRPKLSDLRESGAIEQDADVIVFIYRDEVYNKSDDNPKKGEAEIIVGKQRNGPLGTVRLAFKAQWSRFLPLTQREEEGMANLGTM